MRDAVLWHLRRAGERYGDDLPVRSAATPAVHAPTRADGHTASASAPVPATAPAAPRDAARDTGALAALRAATLGCTRCKLHTGRQQVVFGEGAPDAELMFVGEAPGAREDEQGRPFVGPAGQLLTKIIENAVGLPRTAVYIANVNKCRPPANREPEPDEVAACLPILREQIRLIAPKVIVALGRVAASNLLATTESVGRLRGRSLQLDGIPVVVTWHPAYLLRNPAAKSETWDDIKRVNRLLGRPEVPAPSTRAE